MARFSSSIPISNFSFRQTVYIFGKIIEEKVWNFGNLSVENTYTWSIYLDSTIGEDSVPAWFLNGNTEIVTEFFEGDVLFQTSRLETFFIPM